MLECNAHSLKNKLLEWKTYIYSIKLQVFCVQEMWANEGFLLKCVNYWGHFKNRNGREGGGICIFIRNDVVGDVLPLADYANGKLEIQGVRIHGNNREYIDVVNVYNSGQIRAVTWVELDHYFKQLVNKSIVVGDFNARHQNWNTRHNRYCSTGHNLVKSTGDNSLMQLTYVNMPTYISNTYGTISTLDLCFLSATLFAKGQISLGEDCGSDHCPIRVRIHISVLRTLYKTRQKWKFTKGKWGEFAGKLGEVTKVPGDENFIDEAYDEIVGNIIRAGEEVFGRAKGEINLKYNNNWWTPECEIAVQARRRAKLRLKKYPTIENAVRDREAQNKAKEVIKKTKEEK